METNLKTNPQLPIIGKELLKKLDSKQITMADFNKECAYWMMGDVSTMFYKADNVHKPDILVQYEEDKSRDPKHQVASSFWQRTDVREYTALTHTIRSGNHSNWYWLHFMKKYIDPKDNINQAKIARAMASYPHYEHGFIAQEDWRDR